MNELTGVWALLTLVDGTTMIGRVKGLEDHRELLELEDGWIEIEEACTYHVQMAQVQGGGQAIFAMCLPFAASPDDTISTSVRVVNIATFCPFSTMPEKTRKAITAKVRESKLAASRLAAANAGLVTR